jgi:putative NADH-flavin reductase
MYRLISEMKTAYFQSAGTFERWKMKLVVLGSNGRTGRFVVREALQRGDAVTAVVRSDAKRPTVQHDKLSVIVGDPCDPKFLSEVFRDQDAVISTLGGRKPTKKATSIYWMSADAITEAAWNTGLKKVAVTSSALLFPSNRLVDRFLTTIARNVVQSANRMEQKLSMANLDVVVARCGFLTDLDETRYRAERGSLPNDGSSIPRMSLAQFLVDAIQKPWSGLQVYGVSGPSA